MKINITEKAKTMLEEQLQEHDLTDKGLRIYIAGFGWSGPSYGIALDELKEDDYIEDMGSFKAIMYNDLLKNIEELKVDYVEDYRGKGFTISTGNGGCGEDCSC